jgi:hypothetical protein
MIIELVATWIVIGFFSAVGWNVADKTVNKTHIDPWIEKIKQTDKPSETPPEPSATTK